MSSIAASAWTGGTNVDADGKSIAGTGWGGAGKYANSSGGMIAFGTVVGGASAELTGGNFWMGAASGFMVSYLNHAMHEIKLEKIDSEIDVLENTKGAEGGGHTGLLAGKNGKGWHYVSKDGRENGTMVTGGDSKFTHDIYESKSEALTSHSEYDKILSFKVSYRQAMNAVNATLSDAKSYYNIFLSNCGHAVGAGLRAAGLYGGQNWVPNQRFQEISIYQATGRVYQPYNKYF